MGFKRGNVDMNKKENLTDGARHHQLKIDGIYSESKSWSFTLIKIVK